MAQCLKCGARYKEPSDEQGEHDCPKCGLTPEQRAQYVFQNGKWTKREPPEDVTDLGWANGWKETPRIVRECQKMGHKVTCVDVGPCLRGLENVVTCNLCGYVYRFDSSD